MHANGQDLFTALCEDSAVYALFKHMQGVFTGVVSFVHY